MAHGADRRQTVHRFPTTEPAKFIEVSVAYYEGGANYFSGNTSPRAFYVHVTPITIETYSDGVEIKKFMLFHGRKARLEEAKRFNAKKLNELAARTQRECEAREPTLMQIVDAVLAEENLALAEPAEAA